MKSLSGPDLAYDKRYRPIKPLQPFNLQHHTHYQTPFNHIHIPIFSSHNDISQNPQNLPPKHLKRRGGILALWLWVGLALPVAPLHGEAIREKEDRKKFYEWMGWDGIGTGFFRINREFCKKDRSLIWKPPPHFDRRVPGYIKGYVRRFWQASEDHRGTPESPGRVVTLIDHEYWKEFLREQDEDRYHDDNPSSPSSAPIVWGAAYRIPPQYVETVKTYLDIREINGYSIQHTDFYPASSSPPPLPPPDPTTATTSTSSTPQTTSSKPPEAIKNTLLYIGLPSNPNFLGALHPGHVSAVIAASKGPSGENAEYLFMLEDALEGLGPGCGDDHVRGLGARVRALLLLEETRDSKKSDDGGGKDHELKGMIKTSSVDERTTGDEQAETEKP